MKILKILFLCAFCIIILIIMIAPIENRLITVFEEDEAGNTFTSISPQYPRIAELADILVIALTIDFSLICVVVYTQILTKPQKIPYISHVENN